MNNDFDVDAMIYGPTFDGDDDTEMQETTVIEGGPSGGLFLPDAESDIELDPQLDSMIDPVLLLSAEDGVQATSDHENDLHEEESDDAEEEEDDPIEKTYEIYGTTGLNKQLHLFQYPIRPSDRVYNDLDRPCGARLKPRCGHLEVEIPIPDSAYYDRQRGTEWTDTPLKKQSLAGTIARGRHYLIGVTRGDELHVSPLEGVVQLRPNFSYIDAHDSAQKEDKKLDALADKASRAPRAIQVSAKPSDAVPDLSTTASLRAAEEDKWSEMRWQDVDDDDEFEKSFQYLYSRKTSQVCESLTNESSYLDLLSCITEPDVTVTKVAHGKMRAVA